VKALDNLDVKIDCVIVAVAHNEFKKMKLEDIGKFMNNKPIIVDVRGMFDGEEGNGNGFYYKGL
jgi:UDP-N-acetyl-D-mannosaminuronate dehydrogenase